MKITTNQPSISIDPNQPNLPTDMPIDPYNPLIWVILMTPLLNAIGENLTAMSSLLDSATNAYQEFLRNKRSKK